jgi:hypothetical protein
MMWHIGYHRVDGNKVLFIALPPNVGAIECARDSRDQDAARGYLGYAGIVRLSGCGSTKRARGRVSITHSHTDWSPKCISHPANMRCGLGWSGSVFVKGRNQGGDRGQSLRSVKREFGEVVIGFG